MDGESYQIKIEYVNEEMKVYIIENNNMMTANKEPTLKCALKLKDYVKLDNGTSYLGFTQETLGLVNIASIENWAFSSEIKAN